MTNDDNRPILVVDDDATFRQLIKSLISLHGYDVVEARTPSDALEFLRTRRPLLATIDYRLPEFDGVQLITKIRERGYSDLPIVYLSGTFCDQKKFNILRSLLRVSLVLQKPIVPELFMQQIEFLLPARAVRQHSETAQTEPTDEYYSTTNYSEEEHSKTECSHSQPTDAGYSSAQNSSTQNSSAQYATAPPLHSNRGDTLVGLDAASSSDGSADARAAGPLPKPYVLPASGTTTPVQPDPNIPFDTKQQAFTTGVFQHMKEVPPAMLSQALELQLAQVKQDYLTKVPTQLTDLVKLVQDARANPDNTMAIGEATQLAHKLRGTAGSLGCQNISTAAAKLEEIFAHLEGGASTVQEVLWTEIVRFMAELEAAINQEIGGTSINLRSALATRKPNLKNLLILGDPTELGGLMNQVRDDMVADITLAQNLPTAIQSLQSASFDAVIIDLSLADPSRPFHMATEIRALPEAGSIPIAFLTWADEIPQQYIADYYSASVSMEKPLTKSLLSNSIKFLSAVWEPHKPRILAVDDDEMLLNFVGAVLSNQGITVEPLQEPVKIMKALEDIRPDLVLLDVIMPGMSGYDVCRFIRANETWQNTPIIFLTSRNDAEGRASAFLAGADDFLSKPVLTEELVGRIKSYLTRAKLQKEKTERDSMSGLLTHRTFMEKLSAQIKSAHNEKVPLTVSMVRLTNLMDIINAHGFEARSRFLDEMGKLCRTHFRSEDLRARLTDEIFIFSFPGRKTSTASLTIGKFCEEAKKLVYQDSASQSIEPALKFSLSELAIDGMHQDELLMSANRKLMS